MSKKLPVPKVHFASPSRNAFCPKSAACWSPRIPVMGIPSGKKSSPLVLPKREFDALISGKIDAGTLKIFNKAGSQSKVFKFIKEVRDAFVTSVT
jgi:hypothetical protein